MRVRDGENFRRYFKVHFQSNFSIWIIRSLFILFFFGILRTGEIYRSLVRRCAVVYLKNIVLHTVTQFRAKEERREC